MKEQSLRWAALVGLAIFFGLRLVIEVVPFPDLIVYLLFIIAWVWLARTLVRRGGEALKTAGTGMAAGWGAALGAISSAGWTVTAYAISIIFGFQAGIGLGAEGALWGNFFATLVRLGVFGAIICGGAAFLYANGTGARLEAQARAALKSRGTAGN